MKLPPFWNPWSRFRTWVRENPAQAQIAGIATVSIGFIILMFVVTIIIIIRMLI
jgi:hypothetical protein